MNKTTFNVFANERFAKLGLLTFVNLCALVAAYWLFFNVHYSADTYITYALDDSLVHIRNSRPLGYLAAKAGYLLGLNSASTQPFVTGAFLLILALCTTYIANTISNYLAPEDRSAAKAWAFDLAILLIFVNGFFLDWLRFPEVCLVLYGPTIVLLAFALRFTFTEKAKDRKPWTRWTVVTLLLLAIFFVSTKRDCSFIYNSSLAQRLQLRPEV